MMYDVPGLREMSGLKCLIYAPPYTGKGHVRPETRFMLCEHFGEGYEVFYGKPFRTQVENRV